MKRDPEIYIDVHEGVYAPSDDTYLILQSLEVGDDDNVLEVGTGSGILALHCAKAGARVIATDASGLAVHNARRNAEINDLAIDVIRTDLTRGICGLFDVIVFNPPYLPTDGGGASDELAITGGGAGSELSIRFLSEAFGTLRTGGRIYLLTSSLSAEETMVKARESFRVDVLAKKDLFFERLEVLKLEAPG